MENTKNTLDVNPIHLDITLEDWAKLTAQRMAESKTLDTLCHASPVTMLLIPIIAEELWEALKDFASKPNEPKRPIKDTQRLIEISEGNPGALAFLGKAYRVNFGKAEAAVTILQNADIKGSQIYMLWNDCCNRDTAFTLDAILNCSVEELKQHINYEGGRGIPFEEVK